MKAPFLRHRPLETIFVGGGTPTLLPARALDGGSWPPSTGSPDLRPRPAGVHGGGQSRDGDGGAGGRPGRRRGRSGEHRLPELRARTASDSGTLARAGERRPQRRATEGGGHRQPQPRSHLRDPRPVARAVGPRPRPGAGPGSRAPQLLWPDLRAQYGPDGPAPRRPDRARRRGAGGVDVRAGLRASGRHRLPGSTRSAPGRDPGDGAGTTSSTGRPASTGRLDPAPRGTWAAGVGGTSRGWATTCAPAPGRPSATSSLPTPAAGRRRR